MKTLTRHTGGNHHKTGDHTFTDDVSALREGFTQLRADVTNLMQTAAGAGQHGVGAVRETANDAVESMRNQLAGIKSQAVKSGRKITKPFGKYPVTGALVAFGAGLIIARFVARRKA
jgi:ElaB/YqjD/DUF883 family membrane-anchored ribosome-binding protein